MRRAQGFSAIHGSRAAIIGGVNSTSNVYSAYLYGLTSTGTQAHSWIQSYEDELTAFRKFAGTFPKNCVLLVDTFDTLKSGVPNAIIVAKEMEARGEKLFVMYLEHRMRAFQGTFHANPDYALWYGWSELQRDLTAIKELAADLRKAHTMK